jgi:hypothetical protein
VRGVTELAELAATDELSAFAKAHRVSAEITAHYGTRGGQRVQTGLDLALLARPSPSCVADPGCEDCRRVHALLRELAHNVVPDGWRDAAGPFDAAFRYRRETGWQPEIELVVEMQPMAPVPLAEALAKRELTEIGRRLREMGVAHDRFR